LLIAKSFFVAPSSCLIFVFILSAINSTTLSETSKLRRSAFLFIIAQRVSYSGVLTSARSPFSKRLQSLSVKLLISFGGLSEVKTICFPFSIRELKV